MRSNSIFVRYDRPENKVETISYYVVQLDYYFPHSPNSPYNTTGALTKQEAEEIARDYRNRTGLDLKPEYRTAKVIEESEVRKWIRGYRVFDARGKLVGDYFTRKAAYKKAEIYGTKVEPAYFAVMNL